MTNKPEHIDIQSFDFFQRIEKIHTQPAASQDNLRAKYIMLRKVLEQACYELTTGVTASFANMFSRLDFICKEKKMTPSDRYAIQTMRRNCNAALEDNFHTDMNEYLYDLRAIVRFISLSFEEDIPASILPQIPHSNRPYSGTRLSHIPYVRALVSSWNDTQIFASTDSDEDPMIVINYAKGGFDGDLLYLKDILSENMQINLLDVKVDEDNHYIPGLIIVHPDFLLDISALASCFREYGHHPLNYFMSRIKPKANTHHILMGNLAGQFLDDYINERSTAPVTYNDSLKKFFSASALDFCTCSIPENFHSMAQSQMMNIRSFVNDILPHSIPSFDRNKVLLEASFICEKLGLQGRVDLLQKDFKVLIEQKAGKKDEYNKRHKEDHFIQMMLYQGVLMYNFGRMADDMQTFLLYSRYTDGLMIEHFTNRLFRESIKLRNMIVCNEMAFSDGTISKVSEELNTDLLNELQVHGKLWNDFQEPELYRTIQTLKHCSPLEKAYFQRFYTFISKESVLSRTGGNEDQSKGFAAVWHTPLAEKIENGNILTGLKITDKRKSSPNKGYDIIELSIPTYGEDFLPNFRKGDIIIFYSYKDKPDVRNEILMKGNITEISHDKVTVILRNGQQNKDIIGNEEDTFAIEHDYSDISASAGIRGLFSFLSACQDRKELLIGIRKPSCNKDITLNGSYGRFDELILKEKQAEDYFLLVGPPGTGKTSCALRYMVEEALTEKETSLLLLSYTNRAVDEICSMLVDSGIATHTPFIRIGHEMSCDKRFEPFLMKNRLADCRKLTDIRKRITDTRIFVGTTTSINNRLNLFDIKHFEIAIIDEASQILEPDLTGILSARNGTRNAIDKFVMIGDYKQLPAIALQNAESAIITDRLLLDIGLNDCRNSLFERLYKQSNDNVKSVLRKQGRMHPAIAEFPNNTFYMREKLECVPLPHQEEEYPYTVKTENPDKIEQLLAQRRMIFITAPTPENSSTYSDKTNINEARIVAAILKRIYNLTENSFDANKTVGIIVPYRNQIAMIRKEISKLGIPQLSDISIDTVERYQGSQRDVIIYSFTARNYSQLNFLTSNTFREDNALIDRKLNVAITRARKQLIMTGNPQILGANITFYKLMEYIRMNNGYVETNTDDFCRGNFSIPQYTHNWELNNKSYVVPENFLQAYNDIIGKEISGKQVLAGITEAQANEIISYGRTDFTSLSGLNAEDYSLIYNFYRMRKQYSAAMAMYEDCGNWLRDAINNVSGRVVFCDLSYEAGASGLAFTDLCRSLRHTDIYYLGINPMEAMRKTSEKFFTSDSYRHVKCGFYPRITAINDGFWRAHSVLPELVIFNLSNLFDRISTEEARHLAIHISQIVHARPLNRYVTLYRDDAGDMMNINAYRAFCSNLCSEFKKLNEQMPITSKYYLSKNENVPEYEKFIYEIKSNR